MQMFPLVKLLIFVNANYNGHLGERECDILFLDIHFLVLLHFQQI
jgi:hypothetical protein